jgi:hypothetical protein
MRFADDTRLTEPETRVVFRIADATADFARRSSARPTLTAARISDALAFFSETFAGRLAGAFLILAVTIRW